MTSTNNSTLVDTLRAAVELAKSRWTGLDWNDNDADDVAAVAERLEAGDADAIDDGRVTCWIPDHQLNGRISRLKLLVEDGDIKAAAELARDLADETDVYVEDRADEAGEHGDRAVRAAEAGDWDLAVKELDLACRCEREFGDDPTWSTAHATAEAIRKGLESGAEEVDDVLSEQGRDAVLRTRSDVVGWDESAMNAHAHRVDKVSDLYSKAYYEAYRAGALARVAEIAAHLYYRDGSLVEAGDRVEGGRPGTEDHDTGIVQAIDAAAGTVTVGWDSEVSTDAPVETLSLA